MAQTFLFIWALIFFNTHQVSSQSLQFSFMGFNHSSPNLTLTEAAKITDNGVIQLTSDKRRVMGHAFYSLPVRFKPSDQSRVMSFSTSFAFAMVPEYAKLGGHGFAFAISTSRDLSRSLCSRYLGLMNFSQGNSSNHVFAVEFDTVKDLEFNDINDNHVGIDINSMESNLSVPAAYFLPNGTKVMLCLDCSRVVQAWIDYDSDKNRLDVKLSPLSQKPKLSLMSYDVDLSPVLGEEMYVGFSASTDLLASSHYVLGWNFNMSGEAMSLSLSSLPQFPSKKKKNNTTTEKNNNNNNTNTNTNDNNVGLILGVSLSVLVLIVIIFSIVATVSCIVRKKRNKDKIEDWELDIGPHRFSYQELKQATNGFHNKDLLGFGGFGKVYKGKLPNSDTLVAVKKICHESKQGLHEFMTEISSIGHLRHRNLVQLLGWCRRHEELMLVYEFMPNGSLDKYLFNGDSKRILNWDQRFKIIKGVASGLLYLHEGWGQTVIHRDVKAGNVLLDGEMNARLGDFGLAKLYDHGSNPETTKVVGTLGYLAPELTKYGKPTTGTDVFAFGAVLLEAVCGRRPVEMKAPLEELVLVDWVREKWRSGDILEVVDERLNGVFDESEVVMVLKLGLLCSDNSAGMRPKMRQVVRYLEKECAFPGALDSRKRGLLDGDEERSSCNICEYEEFEDSCRLSCGVYQNASSLFSSSRMNNGR